MGLGTYDFALAIGGEAGQGIATPGDILARIIVRRGLHLVTYNAYQSIVRGGHIFLTMRMSDAKVQNHGDKLDLLMCLNQDTMDRHQRLMGPGTRIVYNSDTINPGIEDKGADLCGLPVGDLTDGSRNRLIQNTVGMGAIASLMGLDFSVLEESLTLRFQRRGQEMVDENVKVARAGYDYSQEHFKLFDQSPPVGEKRNPWLFGLETTRWPWAAPLPELSSMPHTQ